ncbi:MAG: acetylxylan esterase [Gemmatimonadaceae bacterium]
MRVFNRFLLVFLIAPVGAAAQRPDTSITLTVTPDHADWLYQLGDTARFRVTLARGGRPLPRARVVVELAQERMRPIRSDTVSLANGAYTVTGTLREPGFLRVTATTKIDGIAHSAMATAGFEPARIEPSVTMPEDFETFWRAAIADARRVPLNPVMTPMPERSTPDVDVYHVSFQNHAPGSRLYGILSVPSAPGSYPAMLVLPGAGVRPYFPDIPVARRGVIHLRLGIHGIPVDRDSLVYNELRATALARYYTYGLEDRDLYYYKRVIVGVVRAGDFLFQLPHFDGANYAVQGGSQGGGLTIIAGALDPRVKGIAVSHPAMIDQLAFLRHRAGGWPHVFSDTTPVVAKPEKMETIRYYDVANFARLLRVPGIYSWGFNDTVVPPTSVYAAYNLVTAPKDAVIAPPAGHGRVQAQIDRMDAWLYALLGRPR